MSTLAQLYDADAAELYDIIHLHGQELTHDTNEMLIGFLQQANARKILDMSCGTGAQCISLYHAGYDVWASDLSIPMLEKAKIKATHYQAKINFHQADMRSVALGTFDAILSMYNAIGHLSPADFAATIRNAAAQLTPGGILIFDTFNESKMHLLPKKPFVDLHTRVGQTTFKRLTYINFEPPQKRCQFVHQLSIKQDPHTEQILNEDFYLTYYSEQDITQLLKVNGFETVEIYPQSMLDLHHVRESMSVIVARKSA